LLRTFEVHRYPVVEEAATDVIALKQTRGRERPWTDPAFIDKIVALQRQRQARAGTADFEAEIDRVVKEHDRRGRRARNAATCDVRITPQQHLCTGRAGWRVTARADLKGLPAAAPAIWVWFGAPRHQGGSRMTSNTRITDLTDYTSVLPYASERFGVYQPMIGWRGKRLVRRINVGLADTRRALVQAFAQSYHGSADATFSFSECTADVTHVDVGRLATPRLFSPSGGSVLLDVLTKTLPPDSPPDPPDWGRFINADTLESALNTKVAEEYAARYQEQCRQVHADLSQSVARSANLYASSHVQEQESQFLQASRKGLEDESALAGALLGMVEMRLFTQLESLFYRTPTFDPNLATQRIAQLLNADDPFATFDPHREIRSVSLSPLGIVHLFRQFFFELDTFLGTPTGHVWLSPGSTVELIEVSTRRVFTEKTIEQSTETTRKSESSVTMNDEISEAVKEDNKSDLKLGASLTVNQSWGTGNATATASLNMDTTQSVARETSHKRMREQTEKLSTEIKENYKSTFKTITETTDMSSKRYLLNNTTQQLVNYELRRKMRQVGVQVQDIGSYLCWETFVDEPGRDLGLSSLVNIAKPADLVAVPDTTDILPPPDKAVPFTTNLTWNYDDNRQFNGPDGYLPMNNGVPVPPAPEGYEVKSPNSIVDVFQVSGTGEDFSGVWAFKGRLLGSSLISVGPYIAPGGMEWDETINFVVGGVVMFTPNAAKRKEIADANAAKAAAGKAANAELERKTREAFQVAAKLRIEQASAINTRKYEDLRDEERIVVYRRLIRSLMSDVFYRMPESTTNDRTRHTLSELLNSIFDIDKMLYFVAPEWWKPRRHSHQHLAIGDQATIFTDSLTDWSDLEPRPDNYYITDKSRYARMGSSIGWLLQLDGDDLRNAFLNAPWVKAVIPIRPGKEVEATNWLQQMHIEGTDGLDDLYHAPAAELDKIRGTLKITTVTIADAIRYLCAEVAEKNEQSMKVGRYPKEEINDDNKVSAIPIEKVYEHGFYPLVGGFRAITEEPFEVFSQWVEVLPTDQVVPVEVRYDPATGRQVK
jgi:hypothetical protein